MNSEIKTPKQRFSGFLIINFLISGNGRAHGWLGSLAYACLGFRGLGLAVYL